MEKDKWYEPKYSIGKDPKKVK